MKKNSQEKPQRQFPINPAILISSLVTSMMIYNTEPITNQIDPTAQHLSISLSKSPNPKLALLPNPHSVLRQKDQQKKPETKKEIKLFKKEQLNPLLIAKLQELKLLEEFSAFLSNLQKESQIIISFPQEDSINRERNAQLFSAEKITPENYKEFKLKIEKQIQTARLAKICGIDIEKYIFFDRFSGVNPNAKVDKDSKIHNNTISGYAGSKVITSNVGNFNPSTVLHEANHLDSLANNSLEIHEAIYGLTKMLTMKPNWKQELTPEKLIELFEKYQEMGAKNPEKYKFQGQDVAGNYVGTEFSSVETEEALIADSERQLIQVLGQLGAISEQEKFMSPEALDVFNFIRLQKGDISNQQQLYTFKQKITKLEKVDIRNLTVNSDIQAEAQKFQIYLNKVDKILTENSKNIKETNELKTTIRDILREILITIVVGSFLSFTTFLSHPIIKHLEKNNFD